jgi:hypothetical protein
MREKVLLSMVRDANKPPSYEEAGEDTSEAGNGANLATKSLDGLHKKSSVRCDRFNVSVIESTRGMRLWRTSTFSADIVPRICDKPLAATIRRGRGDVPCTFRRTSLLLRSPPVLVLLSKLGSHGGGLRPPQVVGGGRRPSR